MATSLVLCDIHVKSELISFSRDSFFIESRADLCVFSAFFTFDDVEASLDYTEKKTREKDLNKLSIQLFTVVLKGNNGKQQK